MPQTSASSAPDECPRCPKFPKRVPQVPQTSAPSAPNECPKCPKRVPQVPQCPKCVIRWSRVNAPYKREFTLSISVNSRFRPYRIILPRQGGSINIIQVTVYSFTVPALKLMNVKFCLFLATTARCHDRAAIKFISQLLIALICMCAAETYTILIVFGYPYRQGI